MGLDRIKVLVISSNSFNKKSNNGKTLEAIFSKFSSDELAQLFFSENESPDFSFCQAYYKISDTDILKAVTGKTILGEQFPTSNAEIRNTEERKHKFFPILKEMFMSKPFFRELIWRRKFYTCSDIIQWVRKVNPTSIFLLAGDLCFVYDIALYIHQTINIPLCTYFTDDYIIYPQYKSISGNLHKQRLIRLCNSVISKSSLLFSIGDEMTMKYEKRFSRKFYPIMNAVDGLQICEVNPNERKNHIIISYIGGGSRGRIEALIGFGKLLSEVCSNKDYVFNVYLPDVLNSKTLRLFEIAGITYRGAVYGEELQKVKSESNYLLHIESMRRKYYMKTVLSVSTKIPEYLATGKYIIGYGIPWLASMKVLSDNKVGYVVDVSATRESQVNQLKEIIYNPDVTMLRRATDYCTKNYIKEVIASEFYDRIKSI